MELAGVRPYEISIEVSEKTAAASSELSLAQVADAVRRTSVDLPGGSVRTKAGEVILRALGKTIRRGSDWPSVPVATREDGSVVRLGRWRELVDGFEDVDLSTPASTGPPRWW